MQYDFGSENVPERDPTVVESGITEMKGMLDTLRRETVRLHQEGWWCGNRQTRLTLSPSLPLPLPLPLSLSLSLSPSPSPSPSPSLPLSLSLSISPSPSPSLPLPLSTQGKEVNQRGQLYLESRRRSYLKLSTQFRPFTAPPARGE